MALTKGDLINVKLLAALKDIERQIDHHMSNHVALNNKLRSMFHNTFEKHLDEFCNRWDARISESMSHGQSSNTPPSRNLQDKEEQLVSSGFCPEDEHDIVRQPVCDGVKQTLEEGKSLFSPSMSRNSESVTTDTLTQESSLFAQIEPDVSGVSESHYAYAPVSDQLSINQGPIMQNPTSVDSNFPQSVACSPDEARVENENPFPSGEYSELSSVTQNLAALNVSVGRASDRDQSQTVSISGLAGGGDVRSTTQDTSPPFLVSSPPLSDLTSVLPLSIPRHGPDLQYNLFFCSDSEGLKVQNLTPFSSLGKSDVSSFTREAFLVTGPLLMPSRYGEYQPPNASLGTNQVSEVIVAQILALSFPRHGPDESITRFVSTSVLSSVLLLPFPKHGPDNLTSFVITDLLPSQSVGRTSAIRMAEGREAYGRLRPVRRPWF